MPELSYPLRWREVEKHPDDGVVANSHGRFRHRDGFEIAVWSGVVEDATDYTVSNEDGYAIEVFDEEQGYVGGESFVTEEETERAVVKAMRKYP